MYLALNGRKIQFELDDKLFVSFKNIFVSCPVPISIFGTFFVFSWHIFDGSDGDPKNPFLPHIITRNSYWEFGINWWTEAQEKSISYFPKIQSIKHTSAMSARYWAPIISLSPYRVTHLPVFNNVTQRCYLELRIWP